jgi:hypothetical protein
MAAMVAITWSFGFLEKQGCRGEMAGVCRARELVSGYRQRGELGKAPEDSRALPNAKNQRWTAPRRDGTGLAGQREPRGGRGQQGMREQKGKASTLG